MNYINNIKSYIDFIYVINIGREKNKKQKTILQLEKLNIKNYKIIDAINTFDNSEYDLLYKNITKDMSTFFVKNNFSKGALGCLLSHIKCIKDAKSNNYNKILVLEDDFVPIKKFYTNIKELFENVEQNWDLLYLGKKQGNYESFNKCLQIHIKDNFEIVSVNDHIYKPNYQTWGSHSIVYKNTIYDEIISFENNILAPIDIMFMSLYDKYNFYVAKKDIFISDDKYSFIQENIKYDDWNWNYELYNTINNVHIDNVIIWGLLYTDHTHFYIHEMYYNFIKYYYPNLNVYWIDEKDNIDDSYVNNTLIICSPTHVFYNSYPKGKNTYYIIHLDNFKDNRNYKTVSSFLYDIKNLKIIQDNKYIILLCREDSRTKYFTENINKKQICLPWFSNDLYENIIKIKNNLCEHYEKLIKNKYFVYQGSVWNYNIEMIKELIKTCISKKIHLVIRGRIFGISFDDKDYVENTISKYYRFIKFSKKNGGKTEDNELSFLEKKYGIKCLLSLQGKEHNENYISNRAFESISKGYLVVTNNSITKKYFESAIYNKNISELIDDYIKISVNKELCVQLFKDQFNEFFKKFYGYQNIKACFNFLAKVCLSNYNYSETIIDTINKLQQEQINKSNNLKELHTENGKVEYNMRKIIYKVQAKDKSYTQTHVYRSILNNKDTNTFNTTNNSIYDNSNNITSNNLHDSNINTNSYPNDFINFNNHSYQQFDLYLLFEEHSRKFHSDFTFIETNEQIRNCIKTECNSVLKYNEDLDIYLIQEIISNNNYNVYIQESNKNNIIIDFCNKNNIYYQSINL